MEGAVTDAGYDAYATAWRYLGTYIDGIISSRARSRWSKWSKSSSTVGTRKLLWAAYKNTNYKGNQIGEYEFYVDGKWDSSTCVGNKCTPMDCHDPYDSSWELIGVYKETVDFGNDMFYEQLFKHQGYCLWDADKEETDGNDDRSHGGSHDYSDWENSAYQFMQAMRNELPSGCVQIGDMTYGSESNYYIAIKPLSGGDITLGVYLDSSCLEESEYTFEDYQTSYGSTLTSTGTSDAFDTWNANMDFYKVCQPCRAYNRQQMYQDNWDNYRSLTEKYDGQGGYEKNNFNCYDDAHYQNCNQCYKFETHSDMKKASKDDLKAADEQGTILKIKFNGVWYGNGTVGDAGSSNSTKSISTYSGSSSTSRSQSGNWDSYQSYSKKQYSYGAEIWSSTATRYGYGSTGPDANSSSLMSYSIAGGAALLLGGFVCVKAYRKVTARRVALASEDGSKTTPPLV